MAVVKTALRDRLGMKVVGPIEEILKVANRPYRGRTIEDADEALVCAVWPLVQQGRSYVEAVALVRQQQTQQQAEQSQQQAPPIDPAALILQQRAESANYLLAKQKEEVRTAGVLTSVVNDAEQDEEAYWYLYAAARMSPQVQTSERVTTARDFAFKCISGQVEENSVLRNVSQRLDALGFFADANGASSYPPTILEPPGYSSSTTYGSNGSSDS